MKCPRCHGTGKIPNRTRYRVEVADRHQWYKNYNYFLPARSTTNLKEAIKEFNAVTFAEANRNRIGGDEYTKNRARVISISARGKRRTLMEKALLNGPD